MLYKAIKTISKATVKSPNSLLQMNACCWKSEKSNKIEKTFNSHKKEKFQAADS